MKSKVEGRQGNKRVRRENESEIPVQQLIQADPTEDIREGRDGNEYIKLLPYISEQEFQRNTVGKHRVGE